MYPRLYPFGVLVFGRREPNLAAYRLDALLPVAPNTTGFTLPLAA